MPTFSDTSKGRLRTCEEDLLRLFLAVVEGFDCTIITGHRNQADQDKAVDEGKSQLKWPTGNHNAEPSRAVDVAPYPIDWDDRERFTLFAGYVLGIAKGLGIKIRWGGDWDGDYQVKDNKFDDLVHFELLEE